MLLTTLISVSPLTRELTDVIVGTLLGDAKMTFSDIGNAAYVYEQGALHKFMVYFVFGLFAVYTAKDAPVMYERVDSRTGKTHVSYYFSTITDAIFYPYAAMFYTRVPGTRRVLKVLPSNIAELLTPRALAFWIMDDGQYVRRGGVTLCTDNFTLAEVNTLKQVLETKYGLICTLHNKKGNKRIYISGKSLPRLAGIVGPYMHPDFMYKLAK